MSGLSFLTNLAGEINGYKQAQNEQNAQDYAQAARANSELQMLAQQQTYQPQAQAQVAQAGLSQAQSSAQASLVPQQAQLASTTLGTQQSAATAAAARQPVLNQTADNQAAVQQGVTGTQAQLLPQAQANMKLDQLGADQQAALRSTAGLYGAMMQGADSVRNYVQKEADSGAYPTLSGKQVGQVGLTPDGQTFVALDTQGNTLVNTPVSHIQQAFQMVNPAQTVTAKPGESIFSVRNGSATQIGYAPVPEQFSMQHDSALVKNAKWISANVTGGDNAKALKLAQQANSMSKAQFIAQALPNMMSVGGVTDPNKATSVLSNAYDMIRQSDNAGLSSVPNSNTSGNSIINSLIGGSSTNPSAAVDNPFAPDQ